MSGASGSRTRRLFRAREALYQMSYSPEPVRPERIELPFLACEASALPLSHGRVGVPGIEPEYLACHTSALPLSYTPMLSWNHETIIPNNAA